jgi:ABC-type multidrug transport system ATPase subunit
MRCTRQARLTVRECFHFYTTLKTQLDPAGVEKRVDWLVKNLQLDVCENSYVGDNAIRGISGGQKRRVSIGMLVGCCLSRPRVVAWL